MRISTHIDVYEPSEHDYRLFVANSMTNVFAIFVPLECSLSWRNQLLMCTLYNESHRAVLSPVLVYGVAQGSSNFLVCGRDP